MVTNAYTKPNFMQASGIDYGLNPSGLNSIVLNTRPEAAQNFISTQNPNSINAERSLNAFPGNASNAYSPESSSYSKESQLLSWLVGLGLIVWGIGLAAGTWSHQSYSQHSLQRNKKDEEKKPGIRSDDGLEGKLTGVQRTVEYLKFIYKAEAIANGYKGKQIEDYVSSELRKEREDRSQEKDEAEHDEGGLYSEEIYLGSGESAVKDTENEEGIDGKEAAAMVDSKEEAGPEAGENTEVACAESDGESSE